MNILFICAAAPTRQRPRPHGLITALARRGHAVTLLFVDRAGTAFDDLTDRCRQIELVSRRAMLSGIAHREASTGVFDLIHLDGPAATLVVPGLAAPTVVDLATCAALRYERTTRETPLLARLVRVLKRLQTHRRQASHLAHFTRGIVATTGDAWAFCAAGLGVQNLYVVPNPVDLARYSPPTQPRDPATVLLDLRDLDLIERAMALRLTATTMRAIWHHRADIRLLVLGATPFGSIGELAGDPRVTFTGAVADARSHLAMATLALMPLSSTINPPQALLEAMATGTPVVCAPALANELEARAGHELAVASTPQGWARTALELLEDPLYSGRLGRAGRRLIELRHGPEPVITALEHVYATMAGSTIMEWRLEVGLEQVRACE